LVIKMEKKIILRPKEDNTSTFSIRVDKDLLKKYDDLSETSHYSRNELINIAMRTFIDNVEFESNKADINSGDNKFRKKVKKS